MNIWLMRNKLLIYEEAVSCFVPDPFWISLCMRKIVFYFNSELMDDGWLPQCLFPRSILGPELSLSHSDEDKGEAGSLYSIKISREKSHQDQIQKLQIAIKKAVLCPLDIHEYHRVERVLGFISSRRNWNPSPPHPQTVCPPFVSGGGTFDCGTGGGVPNSDEGTDTVVL
jgi:hypothetical protein